MLQEKFRGTTYFAHTQEALNKMIEAAKVKTILQGQVYSYSYSVEQYLDGTVKYFQRYENGSRTKITEFPDLESFKDFYYKRK